MSLQRQHFLPSYLKTLSVGPAGTWTSGLPLGNLRSSRKKKIAWSQVTRSADRRISNWFPCSTLYVLANSPHSLWTGFLFGERVKKSPGEGRKRVRAYRQTFNLGPSFHGTRCATDPDASSYWREHRLFICLIYIVFWSASSTRFGLNNRL